MVRLLLIDDDTGMHRDLRQILDGEFHVSSAYTGAMGIEAARTIDPDVILLDINLPDMSGIDVLPRLDHRRVPVVVMTDLVSDTDADRVSGARSPTPRRQQRVSHRTRRAVRGGTGESRRYRIGCLPSGRPRTRT